MKKLIALVMGMLLVPTMAFGMEAMSDKAQSEVTGQAGVSIAIDDVKLYQNISGLWYTDTDGLGTNPASTNEGAGASVGIDELSVMVQVNAYTGVDGATTVTSVNNGNDFTSTDRGIQGNYEDFSSNTEVNYNNKGGQTLFVAKPLTIDVSGKLPALSTAKTYNNGMNAANAAGVHIGLGTMEVTQSAMSIKMATADVDPLSGNYDNTNGNTANNMEGTDYGTINIGKITMGVLDGSIEIAPH